MRQAPSKPLVVIDTNELVYRTHLLGSPLGAALRHRIHRLSAQLGLPETLEREIETHARRHGTDLAEKLEDAASRFATFIGDNSFKASTDADWIAARWSTRLFEMDPDVVKMPLTLPQVRRAMRRVLAGEPPSGHKGRSEVRDCLIWEAILDAAEEAPVHLITNDKGFFETGAPSGTTSHHLLKEANNTEFGVSVHYGTQAFLEEVETVLPPLDEAEIKKAIAFKALAQFGTHFADAGILMVLNIEAGRLQFYETDVPNELAIQFDYKFPVHYEIEKTEPLLPGHASFAGECLFDTATNGVTQVQVAGLDVVDAAGAPVPGKGVVHLHTTLPVVGSRAVGPGWKSQPG